MKTKTMLTALAVLLAPAFFQGSAAAETAAPKTLAPRKNTQAARRDGQREPVQVADAASEYRAAVFAAQQTVGAIFRHSGLYLSLGGGYARMRAGDFTQTTIYNEVLRTRETADSVAFLHAELSYQFDENWDLSFGATRYGTAEVQLGFPKYPNIFSILPLPDYKKHSLLYQTTSYRLVPTYSFELGDRLRARVGLGLTYNQAKSHVEATYYAWFSGVPNRMISDIYPTEKRSSWSGLVAVGGEYELFAHTSLSLAVAYAPFSIAVPTTPGALGYGTNRPSKSSVRVDTLEAALSLNFRR